mmetsp:Transcript_14606/g.19071  ORF Transcript_14606/g.19071 Transcript_14606/m.19071 type:complete len:324 (-) Transcript_14606:194-1165(-)
MSSLFHHYTSPHLPLPSTWTRPICSDWITYFSSWALLSSLSIAASAVAYAFSTKGGEEDWTFSVMMGVTIGFGIAQYGFAGLTILIFFERRIRTRITKNKNVWNGNFSKREVLSLFLEMVIPYPDSPEMDVAKDEEEWRKVEGTIQYCAGSPRLVRRYDAPDVPDVTQHQVETQYEVTEHLVVSQYYNYDTYESLPTWIQDRINPNDATTGSRTGNVQLWVLKRDPSYAVVDYGADADDYGCCKKDMLGSLFGGLVGLALGGSSIVLGNMIGSWMLISTIYAWMMMQLVWGCALSLRWFVTEEVVKYHHVDVTHSNLPLPIAV